MNTRIRSIVTIEASMHGTELEGKEWAKTQLAQTQFEWPEGNPVRRYPLCRGEQADGKYRKLVSSHRS